MLILCPAAIMARSGTEERDMRLAGSVSGDKKDLRVVCLAYDALDMIADLGCGDMVVGRPNGSDGSRFPNSIEVGGFVSPDLQTVEALQPDLVITSSDIQADVAGDLVRNHFQVLALNNYTIEDIYKSLRLLGRVLGRAAKGVAAADEMRKQIEAFKADLPPTSDRPKVHFEEYYDPCIAGGGWISEMIHLAGGIDINRDLAHHHKARQRVVKAERIQRKNPDIIIAAWCGRDFDRPSITDRKGWGDVAAVRNGHIYTMPQELVLQPSPKIIKGIEKMRAIIQSAEWAAEK